jgi:UDPglucose 6-dehydrogenase
MTKIGFIGIGKLGLPCAEAMSRCYDVTGYDIYQKTSDLIKIATNLEDAVKEKKFIFVAVQTPHEQKYDGREPTSHLDNRDFNYETVKDVLREINQHVTHDQIVVLISTVLPGVVREHLYPCITNARFVYNPYLIAMGSVSWDMVNPEMVMIGTHDGSTTDEAAELVEFYRPLMENDPRYVIGTWEECESIKVFYNTFISAKIGLVNMIQDVAMKIGNVNVDVVTDALANSTIRIMSPKYMTAGMGDAGPCHPRDNIALRYLAEKLNLGYDIFDTIMQAREQQAHNIALYLNHLHQTSRLPIVIMGKAYKPDVEYIDGSYSLLIGHYLKSLGAEYMYCDPLTGDHIEGPILAIALLAHNRSVTYQYSGEQPNQELYVDLASGSIIVDPWRSYPITDQRYRVIHYGNTRKQ